MVHVTRVEATITAQNKLRPGLANAARELDRFRAQQTKATAAFGSMAARVLGGVGGGLAAINGARQALASAVSLERKMYDVQRATDTSGAALKAQETVILDLARATGKTKEELADLYAAAFAGRPLRELRQFTEYAAQATVAWGTNAKDTGQALAEIGNIYNANQRRIEAIGDAINTVADSSASAETDLIEFLRRVGGAGDGLKISAENMLAFGAALKEVGVRTDVASTGMNAMLTKIAVPDEKFDKALKSIGLNVKAFRAGVDRDATGSILKLLGALKKIDGTKRMAALKELFGMEYADDISRLVGGLDRVNTLLGIANDKTKALGSVRKGAALAAEKDFNKFDRATQSMDVVMSRVGNHLKEIGGGFADIINAAVDTSEKAKSRLDRMKEIEDRADTLEGKPPASAPPPREDPLSQSVMDRRARESLNDPRTDDASLHGLAVYGGTEEIRAAAEAEYRRRRLAKASRAGLDKEATLAQTSNTLIAKSLIAGPDNIHAERIQASLGEMERIRQGRLVQELDDLRIVSAARPAAAAAQVGMVSQSRLGSFGAFPLTTGDGKGARTYQAPKIDVPGFDGVDLTAEGTRAGAGFVDALNAELDKGMAETAAKVERFKALLNFTASPTVKVGVSTGAGFNTGKSMQELHR